VLVALARGIAVTVDALRARRPEAVMVHVDAMSIVSTVDPALQPIVDDLLEHQFLALDLAEGRVTPEHRMWRWLHSRGIGEAQLQDLAGGERTLEVYGGNFYPQMSAWVVEGSPDRPRRRRRLGGGDDLQRALTVAHERLGRPVLLTETSAAGSVRLRERWLAESVPAVARARAAGADVIGYTWFPAFSLVAWSYRRGRKPVESYFAHMGLWDLRDDGRANLRRDPTGLERRFADLVAAGEAPVDELRPSPAGACVA
jgi:hypothetical protein